MLLWNLLQREKGCEMGRDANIVPFRTFCDIYFDSPHRRAPVHSGGLQNASDSGVDDYMEVRASKMSRRQECCRGAGALAAVDGVMRIAW